MELDVSLLMFLVLAAGAAGYVDAVAGGGGLITVPALLLCGLTPAGAVATNKLQGTFGVAAATHTFWRAGHLDLHAIWPVMLAAAAGAAAGALSISLLDSGAVSALMPYLLFAVAGYFTMAPRLRETQKPAERAARPKWLTAAVVPIGYYDGFFGPGAGALYVLAFVVLRGHDLLTATASTKAANLASNAAALMVFVAAGGIAYELAFPMLAAQILGARLGARAAIRNSDRLIRPLLVIICLLTALRLLIS